MSSRKFNELLAHGLKWGTTLHSIEQKRFEAFKLG